MDINDNYIYVCRILYDNNKYYWTIITQAGKRQYPFSNDAAATGLYILSFLFLLKGEEDVKYNVRVVSLFCS